LIIKKKKKFLYKNTINLELKNNKTNKTRETTHIDSDLSHFWKGDKKRQNKTRETSKTKKDKKKT
jgi:hypothetical protein